MAIRTRILLVVLGLVLGALCIVDVVSYDVVSDSLTSKADSQMQAAAPLIRAATFGGGGTAAACAGLYLHSFGILETSIAGQTQDHVMQCAATAPSHAEAVRLVNDVPASLIDLVSPNSGPVYTTHAGYRMMAEDVTLGPLSGSLLVVGEPISSVDSTLGSVLILEIIVSLSVLVATGAIALFLVQLGLLPLEKMARTATEIAAGDLSRRVDDVDERTEVGQLGASLNVMLERIESAFRDKELSEEQLRRFVADASHELRTPLTSIRGYAELLQRSQSISPSDAAAAIGRIESESERMSELVEDLFLLARLDQGRPIERGPVDLAELAADAVNDARVLAPDRAITLQVDGELLASGSEGRLRQVLVNLVSNALSYTPAASPLEVTGERSGEIVRLQVIDHGPGIPAEDRAKVFDRFWRADDSRHRAGGGSGLGLSIVAAVVAAHHGRVDISETPGGGATFVLELPALPPEQPPSTGRPADEMLVEVPPSRPE